MARRNGSTRAWRTVRTQVLAHAAANRLPCSHCGRPIDYARRGPYRDAPSVDHIVAVDEGGTDDPSNLRPVHCGCNSHIENARRRARGLDTRARPKRIASREW